MYENLNPDTLAMNHGIAPIGASQRTIAYTVVAADGTGFVKITAAAHGLKKHQTIYITAGAYIGTYKVTKVYSSSQFQIAATFGATAAGNITLTACLDGFGFYADSVPITIAELTPDQPLDDTVAFIATTFIAGVWYPYPFKKIRITGGNITCVRKPPQAILTYTNR
jgi:hypothetical protein